MAQEQIYRPTQETEELLLGYVSKIMERTKNRSGLHAKLEAIDLAYARYKAGDEEAGKAVCESQLVGEDFITPVTVAQVDSLVAYLAEIFLSGRPIFPVVSTPKYRKAAEGLEAIIDYHATVGGYPRQLLIALRDAIKYNLGAVEVNWVTVGDLSVIRDNVLDDVKINYSTEYYNQVRALDMYNLIFDQEVPLGDIGTEGDFLGYVERMSRVRLKRLIAQLQDNGTAIIRNIKNALQSGLLGASYYTEKPVISEYVTTNRYGQGGVDGLDYLDYLQDQRQENKGMRRTHSKFEIIRMNLRIIPDEFKMRVPKAKTPQIWSALIVNNRHLIELTPVYSPYGYFPILLAHPNDDGYGLQTASTAERAIDIQEISSALYRSRLAASRRAVGDRGIYDPRFLLPTDVNNPAPAAKYPLQASSLVAPDLNNVYRQIPFDSRGMETVAMDAQSIISLGRELSGLNQAQQGQFVKGNKSVTEFETIMGASDSRLRLPALVLESNFFTPLKLWLKWNIYRWGTDMHVVSTKSGDVLDIQIREIQEAVLSFRLADGYNPKSKLASTEFLLTLVQATLSSPVLAQQMGPMLPNMIAHLAQLGGVQGLEEYIPEQPNAEAGNMGAGGGVAEPPQPT